MTTFDGLMEKMDNSDDEFMVPERLQELYKAKDYGRYADETVILSLTSLVVMTLQEVTLVAPYWMLTVSL